PYTHAQRPAPSTTPPPPPTGSTISRASAPRTCARRTEEAADGAPTPDHRRRHRGHERHAHDPRGGARALRDHAGERREAVLAHGAAVLPRPLDRREPRLHGQRRAARAVDGEGAPRAAGDRAR